MAVRRRGSGRGGLVQWLAACAHVQGRQWQARSRVVFAVRFANKRFIFIYLNRKIVRLSSKKTCISLFIQTKILAKKCEVQIMPMVISFTIISKFKHAGVHEYKFVVDGQWCHDVLKPSKPNSFSSHNNIIGVALVAKERRTVNAVNAEIIAGWSIGLLQLNHHLRHDANHHALMTGFSERPPTVLERHGHTAVLIFLHGFGDTGARP